MFLFIPYNFPNLPLWYTIGIEIASGVGLAIFVITLLGTVLTDAWRWIDDLPSHRRVGPYDKFVEYCGMDDDFMFNFCLIMIGVILASFGALAWPLILLTVFIVALGFCVRFIRRTYKRVTNLNDGST